MLDFFRKMDYYHMRADNSLVVLRPDGTYTYVFAHRGCEYVMYAAEGSGGDFGLTLRPGRYRVWWISTTSGEIIAEEDEFNIDAEQVREFHSPGYKDDIILHIKNITDYEPSTDASVRDIMVGGRTVPGFDACKLSYNMKLPYGTASLPKTEAMKMAAGSRVSITAAESLPGTSVIKVTSEDDSASKIYTINFSVEEEVKWPLKAERNSKYLTDCAVNPVFLFADTASTLSLIDDMSEIEYYLQDRKNRGFNSIICNYSIKRQENIGRIIGMAKARNLQVMLNISLSTADEYAITADNARECGKSLACKYKDADNIIWVIDGNNIRAAEGNSIINEFAEGIRECDRIHLLSFIPENDASSSQYFHNCEWLDFNVINSYSPEFTDTYKLIMDDRDRNPAKPVIDLKPKHELYQKSRYEMMVSQYMVRADAVCSILSGACGMVYGNINIAKIGSVSNWKNYLDLNGMQHLINIKRLFESYSWFKLEPDSNHTFVSSGHESVKDDYPTVAAFAFDGSFAVVYLPDTRTIALNMGKLRGSILAGWFDPTNGDFTRINEIPFENRGYKDFLSPAVNYMGQMDFLLVLEAV